MVCGNSLPASFRSDCVLKYELSKLAFSLSSVYIISFPFRGGVMLYLELIKMILESSTNLYCLSYGWKLVYLLDCQSRFFFEDHNSLVVSMLSRVYWSQCCCNCVRLALS